MKVVILCGGKGTRLKEHTEYIPKPLVEIGHYPILWHVMKIYAHSGFTDFVLCLGYKGEKIREYFASGPNARVLTADQIEYRDNGGEAWHITFADTGPETNTGGRVKLIEPHIDDDTFLVTYGDGVSDVNLRALLDYHRSHQRTATLTSVQPLSQFGILDIDEQGCIQHFREKPRMNVWVNGGFFVFNRSIFEYLGPNDVLEGEPFERMAAQRQIMAYQHRGFWACMDTYKDTLTLNELWSTDRAGWKLWQEIAV
jgi:glucose-1-phosphate cytidylyltransferase